MDELSLFAFAGTPSSDAKPVTGSDPVDATSTPVDDAEFVAALKIFVPDVDDAAADDTAVDVGIVGETTDDTEAVDGETGLPIDGISEQQAAQVELNDTQAVWTIAESGFVAADRQLPSTELLPPETPTSVVQEDQTIGSDVSPSTECCQAD
ncbi:MAG: hypothetical protein ABGZ53_28265 [Fuerstiella sp.]